MASISVAFQSETRINSYQCIPFIADRLQPQFVELNIVVQSDRNVISRSCLTKERRGCVFDLMKNINIRLLFKFPRRIKFIIIYYLYSIYYYYLYFLRLFSQPNKCLNSITYDIKNFHKHFKSPFWAQENPGT